MDTQTKSQYPTGDLSTSLPLLGGTSLHPSHPTRSSKNRGSAFSCKKNAQFSGCIIVGFFQPFFFIKQSVLTAAGSRLPKFQADQEISYLANFLLVTGS